MKKYTIEVCEKVEMYETYTLEVPEDVDIKDVIKDIDNSNGQYDVFEIMDSYDINVTKFGEVGATLLNTTVIDVKESNKRNYKN